MSAPLRYISVCSGIEAAFVAWRPLGWEPVVFAEIDAFPSAVLRHHYPGVPNAGDFRSIRGDEYGPIDLLVGGTPCQDFSIAGLREGLGGERGNLTLEFLRLAQRLRPRWLVWENVPGVYSSTSHVAPDPCEPGDNIYETTALGADALAADEYDAVESHAFACFLAGLQELRYGFAYRTLDAQFFGVPQRRRRVFVVGYLGAWQRAAAVLFEPHCLSGHPPPRREAGEGTIPGAQGCAGERSAAAPTLPARRSAGGGFGTDFDCDGGLICSEVAPRLGASGRGFSRSGDSRGQDCLIASTGETSHCLNAGGMGRQDYETETLIAHSLSADGFDASEDGTGRGIPLVPANIAFDCKASGRNGFGAGETAPTLRAMPGKERPNGGGQLAVMTLAIRGLGHEPELECRSDGTANAILTPNGGRGGIGVGAVAFQQNHRDEVRLRGGDGDISGSISADCGSKQQTYLQNGLTVRRLTPRECERLQGFPDDYTAISFRGKPARDGPRYKALGNSMAVPVMRWIGEGIAMVEEVAP
jgi:DNA (cytosine-5)-methyltransferase 1